MGLGWPSGKSCINQRPRGQDATRQGRCCGATKKAAPRQARRRAGGCIQAGCKGCQQPAGQQPVFGASAGCRRRLDDSSVHMKKI
eukprot:scaffold3550_cov112-Isochrysis_galbana.AAC.19